MESLAAMESVFNILSAENVRTLATLVSIFCIYVLMRTQMKEMGHSLSKRIDELKYNDLAHLNARMDALNSTIEALTYALEKNGSLKPEDKEFVDSRLAR